MVGRHALGNALGSVYCYWGLVGLSAVDFGHKTDHGFGETRRELVCRANDCCRDVVWMGFRPGMVGLFAK